MMKLSDPHKKTLAQIENALTKGLPLSAALTVSAVLCSCDDAQKRKPETPCEQKDAVVSPQEKVQQNEVPLPDTSVVKVKESPVTVVQPVLKSKVIKPSVKTETPADSETQTQPVQEPSTESVTDTEPGVFTFFTPGAPPETPKEPSENE